MSAAQPPFPADTLRFAPRAADGDRWAAALDFSTTDDRVAFPHPQPINPRFQNIGWYRNNRSAPITQFASGMVLWPRDVRARQHPLLAATYRSILLVTMPKFAIGASDDRYLGGDGVAATSRLASQCGDCFSCRAVLHVCVYQLPRRFWF